MPTPSTSVLDNLDTVAVLAAGFFAGTAFYITIGEVPALRAFGLDEHWRFFPYMYEKAAVSQSVCTTIAGVAGIVHGTRINGAPFYRNLWIIAGSVFVGVLPYTVICMFPTNKLIINDNKRVRSGNESQIDVATKKDLLDKWAVLHLVRTVGSVASFGAMVFGLSRHTSLLLGW
jgi:hypothetical protein